MKTVLVTGASGGIGAATAVLFAQKGYRVILHYFRSAQSARLLCDSLNENGGHCVTVRADIRSSAQVNAMFSEAENRFGGVDILVNNAGIARQKLATEITDDEWADMLAVNLSGVFYCCRAAAPGMVRKKAGSIVNISSVWGVTGGSCEAHYSAAKAGVIGLTKALAKELGPSGIRVNCVAPGVVATRMNTSLSVGELTELSERTALERIADAGEIAAAVLFLAEETSSYITGQVLGADGGFPV